MSLPPGPDGLVTMAQIRDDPLGFLHRMHELYGPVTAHSTERDRVIMISAPELVGEMFLAGEERFTKQGTPDDLMLTPVLGEGLLTTHGEQWRRQRELTAPMFERHRVERFAALMVQEAQALADRWLSRPHGGPVRVDHDLSGLTLTVIAGALLSGDLSGIGHGFGEAVDAVNSFMSHGDPLDTPDTDTVLGDEAAYPRAQRLLDGIVAALVRARVALGHDEDGSPDLLAALLDARDPVTGRPLAGREIHAQVLTMVMAGHETTAKALTWALYLLDRNPEVKRAAQAEVEQALRGRAPTVADLPQLPLCRAVLQEAMRLYPPIWVISRRAASDQELGGWAIPAGSLVCVSPWILHRDPQRWAAPELFDPTRFLDHESLRRSPYSYFPFGTGPRQCLGRRFAMLEAHLVLATLLTRVDLRLVPGEVVEPQALVTLRPANGLLMTVGARQAPSS